RLYKSWAHEGGTSTPLIAHWPRGLRSTGLFHAPGHIIDLLPTFLEAAGAEHPTTRSGQPTLPLEGRSLLPLLRGAAPPERTLFWEHEGNRAVQDGPWKLVALNKEPWELYDIVADRTELKNLAAQEPDRVRELAAKYDAWAQRCGVLPWNEGHITK